MNANQAHATLLFPTTEEVERFWKSKAGYCHGCEISIALEDQYCDSCREFLLLVDAESREQTHQETD